ncbi:helix-turn-helix transcriptional regulator [Streptomyces sp. NPDC049813]|uniref:helix-turn-helix transcriptional regulator n=1 Tax=Streptomyces sp. NPDC049813 TaxID=3365597 RepID=UPI0037959C11
METLRFDSTDIEATEEFLSQAYAQMRIGNGTTDSSRARIRRDAMAGDVTPLGRICLCVVHDGTIQDHGFAGVEDAFGPGDVVSFAPPELPYQNRICGARYNITMLDPALLNQVAATAPHAAAGPVRLTGHRPTSEGAAQHLRRTIVHVREHVLHVPEVAAQPLAAATAAQYLAGAVLAAFPHTALTEPTASDRRDARPASLRPAVAYMEEHAAEPLTVAGIAAAAHVTVRGLQYAFRCHLDTTPLAYLRRVRLSLAHQDLVGADPSRGATVTSVAAAWGFYHPGRFAAHYRAAYGYSPHRTLAGR